MQILLPEIVFRSLVNQRITTLKKVNVCNRESGKGHSQPENGPDHRVERNRRCPGTLMEK